MVEESDVTMLQDMNFTKDLDAAVADADMIMVATNHSLYTERKEIILDRVAKKQTRVVDLWNSLETGSVFLD
jgi:UDP-N-acetyl-D-mannosaminuronate dehydrogenase